MRRTIPFAGPVPDAGTVSRMPRSWTALAGDNVSDQTTQ